jgi:hypothetical protein
VAGGVGVLRCGVSGGRGGGLLCSSWLSGVDKGGKVDYFRKWPRPGRLPNGGRQPGTRSMGDGPSTGRLAVLPLNTFAIPFQVSHNCRTRPIIKNISDK